MKECYTSPEMKLLSFAPTEPLANSDIDFSALMAGMGDTVISGGDDVDVEINITMN